MYGPQGPVYGPPRQVRPACVKKVRDVFAPSRWERSDVWTDARTSAWGDYEITTRSRRDYDEILLVCGGTKRASAGVREGSSQCSLARVGRGAQGAQGAHGGALRAGSA